MTFQKKIRNKFQITRGRAKQKLGRATGNRRLRAEGVADRIGGNVRQAGEQMRDAGRDLPPWVQQALAPPRCRIGSCAVSHTSTPTVSW